MKKKKKKLIAQSRIKDVTAQVPKGWAIQIIGAAKRPPSRG